MHASFLFFFRRNNDRKKTIDEKTLPITNATLIEKFYVKREKRKKENMWKRNMVSHLQNFFPENAAASIINLRSINLRSYICTICEKKTILRHITTSVVLFNLSVYFSRTKCILLSVIFQDISDDDKLLHLRLCRIYNKKLV